MVSQALRTAQNAKKLQAAKKPQALKKRPDFECVALVLQGGGALGSYQAGVYEAMAEADLHLDWVAGISIGAMNAAIIAGNAREDRVKQLKGFWETITANPLLDWMQNFQGLVPQDDNGRRFFNRMSANMALLQGTSGFFEPRPVWSFFGTDDSLDGTSFYDTNKLKTTLETFVDFDRLNKADMRFSIGAVNVRTGNFTYFENKKHKIRAEHVMASGSLPPGFAPVEIDGEFYWDGGLVSNTPLQWVVNGAGNVRQDTLAFQVDLWPARGNIPRNLIEVIMRQKEIQYSSRTRAGTDNFKNAQRIRSAVGSLLEKLPANLRKGEDIALLEEASIRKVYNIVELIYRTKNHEMHSKDYEFSHMTMQENWSAGHEDASRCLSNPKIFKRPTNPEGFAAFDFSTETKK